MIMYKECWNHKNEFIMLIFYFLLLMGIGIHTIYLCMI